MLDTGKIEISGFGITMDEFLHRMNICEEHNITQPPLVEYEVKCLLEGKFEKALFNYRYRTWTMPGAAIKQLFKAIDMLRSCF